MRYFIRSFMLVCLGALAALTAQAEPGILWVKVIDLKDRPIGRIRVGVEGPESSDLTDDRGLARIRLAPQPRLEAWATLKVSGGDYAFVSPWDRKIPIPSYGNGLENPLRIYLTDRGDREALKNIKFIVASAAKCNAMLKPRSKGSLTTEEERKSALTEVAQSFGLTPEEVDQAIREWGQKAADPYDKGVIALYLENYPEATTQLSRSYEMRKAVFEKALAEMVDVAFSLGQSLYGQGRYREAVEKLREANTLRNDDASIMVYLGSALAQVGQYTEAEPLLKRFRDICEKSLGADHQYTARSLNYLGDLYKSQGKYADAAPLFKRAIVISEKVLGADHSDAIASLGNLADLYSAQGKYADAEPLLKRVLAISEKALGADHLYTAAGLNNLASLYISQGRYAEAEPLLKRAIAVSEKSRAADHPETAKSLDNLARLYVSQGRYADAEPLYKRALSIWEKSLGVDSPDTAINLNNLADLYTSQGKYADAEPLLKRALAISEKLMGVNHPFTAASLNSLAELYRTQGKYAAAEPLYKRAIGKAGAINAALLAVAILSNSRPELREKLRKFREEQTAKVENDKLD